MLWCLGKSLHPQSDLLCQGCQVRKPDTGTKTAGGTVHTIQKGDAIPALLLPGEGPCLFFHNCDEGVTLLLLLRKLKAKLLLK